MDLYALPHAEGTITGSAEDSEHTVGGVGKQLEPWAAGTKKATSKKEYRKVANSDGSSDEEAATSRDAALQREELREGSYDKEMGYVLTEHGRGNSSEGVGVIRMGGRLRSEEVRRDLTTAFYTQDAEPQKNILGR
jgi:hypothetical protein